MRLKDIENGRNHESRETFLKDLVELLKQQIKVFHSTAGRTDCFETYLGQECSFGSSHERIGFVRASVFVVDVTTPKSLPARCWTFCLFLLKTHHIVEGFSNSVTSANPVAIQPTAEPQNLSWREAIVEVLKGANGAMHYSDIADEIVARRLRSEIGPTPSKRLQLLTIRKTPFRHELASLRRPSEPVTPGAVYAFRASLELD